MEAPFEGAAIRPLEDTGTFQHPVEECPPVDLARVPGELPLPGSLTGFELTSIDVVVVPGEGALTVHLVIAGILLRTVAVGPVQQPRPSRRSATKLPV